MNPMNGVDWLGSIGVFMILLAYFLNLSEKISPRDLLFILLNLVGAAMACLASVLLEYIPFIILEGAWTMVSLIALIRFGLNPGEIKKSS